MQKELYSELAKYILKILKNKNSQPDPDTVGQLFMELRELKH